MSTESKDGTKNVPPPTGDEDRGRVTAETVVADGDEGMERCRGLLGRIIRTSIPTSPSDA